MRHDETVDGIPCTLLPEQAMDGIFRLRRQKMAIALDHFFRLMADPGVDHPLINSRCGGVGTEAMPQDMPAFEFFKATAAKDAFEVIVSFVRRERHGAQTSFSRTGAPLGVAERMHAAGVLGEPLAQD